ncbi:MAG: NADAR domain-containing protein [Calothrix sp. MO_167.B12]|nr:NADAR domain-containing protein [Calothrix sp. MO_167.B12]
MTIYFYKAWQPYGCFSNFSPHEILIEGTYWSTVEHYYQAQKFVGTKDEVIIPLIHSAETPEKAAELGRCSTRQVRPDWNIVKTTIMRTAVLQKFRTHTGIREILLATGEELLVENSPTDYFWGCGGNKSGQNHLGKILMSVRDELRHLPALEVLAESNS